MSVLLVIIASVLFCQQGVVVIEDIAQLNQLLRVPNQEPDVLLKSLQQLSQKLPSREILKQQKQVATIVYMCSLMSVLFGHRCCC